MKFLRKMARRLRKVSRGQPCRFWIAFDEIRGHPHRALAGPFDSCKDAERLALSLMNQNPIMLVEIEHRAELGKRMGKSDL